MIIAILVIYSRGVNMYTVNEYIKPTSAEQVCELLAKSKRNKIVAGNMWLRLSRSKYNTIIDITGLQNNNITENEKTISIGACTTLRQIENSKYCQTQQGTVLKEILQHIVGIQFRNTATIGGNIFLKHGFSDIITFLSALNAQLIFHKTGKIQLSEYLNKNIKNDLLTEIVLSKDIPISFASYKQTATDLSAINVAIAKFDNKINVAIGSRPAVAEAKIFDISTTSEDIANSFIYGSNMRASAEYRFIMAKELINNCLCDLK